MALLTMLTPYQVTKKDSAVAQGSVGQFRFMGAGVGVAIATCVLNSYLETNLSGIITPAQLKALLESSASVEQLPDELKRAVKLVFAKGYNLQIEILIAFSAAQIPATLLMWQKEQVILKK